MKQLIDALRDFPPEAPVIGDAVHFDRVELDPNGCVVLTEGDYFWELGHD